MFVHRKTLIHVICKWNACLCF